MKNNNTIRTMAERVQLLIEVLDNGEGSTDDIDELVDYGYLEFCPVEIGYRTPRGLDNALSGAPGWNAYQTRLYNVQHESELRERDENARLEASESVKGGLLEIKDDVYHLTDKGRWLAGRAVWRALQYYNSGCWIHSGTAEFDGVAVGNEAIGSSIKQQIWYQGWSYKRTRILISLSTEDKRLVGAKRRYYTLSLSKPLTEGEEWLRDLALFYGRWGR